jgi:hypothetical protein
MNRLNGAEIGANGRHIFARHLGVGRVRHRGIEPRTVSPDTLAHRIVELVVRPCPNAGLHIGCDVGRTDITERSLDRAPARERRVWRGRVARGTIRRRREVSTAFDLMRIL